MKANLEYADDLIRKAKNHIEKAEEEIKRFLSSHSDIISWCQTAIELSGKAIFKIMGLEYPRDHQLLLERRGIREEVKELLKKEFPKYFYRKDDIPRVLFLTYFWHNFYTLAKYGIEELDFPPDKLFGREDAELALKHAKECVAVADDLLIFKRTEEGE